MAPGDPGGANALHMVAEVKADLTALARSNCKLLDWLVAPWPSGHPGIRTRLRAHFPGMTGRSWHSWAAALSPDPAGPPCPSRSLQASGVSATVGRLTLRGPCRAFPEVSPSREVPLVQWG